MKFNSNRDVYTGKNYKYPIHKVVNSKIYTRMDPHFPPEYEKIL